MKTEDINEQPVPKEEVKTEEPMTGEEIKSVIEGDIEQLHENASATDKNWEEELKSMEDKYMRLYAEFDNFRKRTANERIELFKTANQEVLVALLPVLDDFERALKSMNTSTDIESVKEGIHLVSSKFKNILTSKGLKPMEAQGLEFNPDLHEAITKIPAPSDELKDKVVDVVESGYLLGDKVIRYAKVVVGE
jgi:molecular chaperone GrpE